MTISKKMSAAPYVDNVALYLTNALRIDAEHLTVIVNAKINAATRTIGE